MMQSGIEFFEGCEKVLDLEIKFVSSCNNEESLRNIPRCELDVLVGEAKASILSQISSEMIDSYVLSESSLFVWDNRILLKTCGNTTPLLILERLFITMSKYVGDFVVERCLFSRKCFFRPTYQVYPHKNQLEEEEFMKKYFPEIKSFVFNKATESEWIMFAYLSEESFFKISDCDSVGGNQINFQMMMWGLDEKLSKQFYSNAANTFDEMTKLNHIESIVPNCNLDGFVFKPFGYSMNGLKDDFFQTIHVTPQDCCSYASFECNASLNRVRELFARVYDIFKPKNLIVVFYCPSTYEAALNVTLSGLKLIPHNVSTVALNKSSVKYLSFVS